jgi:hypothetical protein
MQLYGTSSYADLGPVSDDQSVTARVYYSTTTVSADVHCMVNLFTICQQITTHCPQCGS